MTLSWVLQGKTFSLPKLTFICWLSMSLALGAVMVASAVLPPWGLWLIYEGLYALWFVYDTLVGIGKANYAKEVHDVIPKQVVILLFGILATGKSKFARHLAREHGFAHYDLECWPRGWPSPELKTLWDTDRAAFVLQIRQNHDRVILDWGFPVSCVPWVRELRDEDVRLVWFDGDVHRAREAFARRGGIDMAVFQEQVWRIQRAGYPGSLNCLVVPALSASGVFLDEHSIESIVFQ